MSYYKRNAKKRNLEWSITLEQFDKLIFSNCYYCGDEPRVHELKRKTLIYNGLDRVDNNKGYIIDNVVACCTICNMMKYTLSLDDFKIWSIRLKDRIREWYAI